VSRFKTIRVEGLKRTISQAVKVLGRYTGIKASPGSMCPRGRQAPKRQSDWRASPTSAGEVNEGLFIKTGCLTLVTHFKNAEGNKVDNITSGKGAGLLHFKSFLLDCFFA